GWGAVAADAEQSLHEVRWLSGNRQRIPAELIRRGFRIAELVGEQAVVNAGEAPMYDGGPDPGEPGPAGRGSWRSKCSTRDLLRIQPVGRALRGVTAGGQSARQRFGRKIVCESCLIGQRFRGVRSACRLFARAESGGHNVSSSPSV